MGLSVWRETSKKLTVYRVCYTPIETLLAANCQEIISLHFCCIKFLCKTFLVDITETGVSFHILSLTLEIP